MNRRIGRMLRSTTARLIVPMFLFQLVATGSVLLFVRAAGQRALEREQRNLVADLREDFLADYREGGLVGLRRAIDARVAPGGGEAPVLMLLGADGKRLAGNLRDWPPLVPANSDWTVLKLYRDAGVAPEEMALSARTLPQGARLLAGRAIEGDAQLRQGYEQGLVAALLLAIPLTLLISLVFARLISRRAGALADTARQVSEGALHARAPLDGSGDGFDLISVQINTMLERIERLVAELRVLTDGLAHDLASPLTRLRTKVEQLDAQAWNPDARAAVDAVTAEIDKLTSMLATAIQISRTEAGIGRDRFVSTDLSELAGGLADLYAPYAEERGFELVARRSGPVRAPVDRELIGQALSNLLENAIAYADGGSHIVLSVAQDFDQVTLAVADDGRGIAAADRGEALRRFGRLDPARQRPGSGLGLSLVEATARLHGGTIELADNFPGLVVRLRLPNVR
jgi:signal transduction histidine kinase